MRKLLLIILLLALMLALTGCPRSADPETTPRTDAAAEPTAGTQAWDKTLSVCMGTEWYTIDPSFVNDEDTATYILHMFEGLMKYVPQEETEPLSGTVTEYGMAERYTVSEDGLTYTFILREDARWSDGEPVTAEDFVYSWQRVLTPNRADTLEHASGGHQLSGIVKNAAAVESGKLQPSELGVTAVDERTLEVQLEAPCAYFLKLCTSPSLVPLRRDVIETYGGDWTDMEHIVSNGAYTVSEWVHDDYLKMEQNPYYYDRENLGADTIVWYFSDGEQLTLDAYENGEYDFIGTFPESQVTALRETGEYHTVPRAGTYYLYFNNDVIADWRVRAAMVLAVDRESILSDIGEGYSAATGFVPEGICDSAGTPFTSGMSGTYDAMFNWLQSWHPDYDLSTYEGRCSLAKTLYQESLNSGAWHRSYEVTYCYNSSSVNRAVARVCQKNWRDVLGLTVHLSVVDANTYPELLKDGSFGVAYLSWMPDYDDAQNFLSLMQSGGAYNYGMWESTAFDDLLTKIDAARDTSERDELQYFAENQMFSLGGFPVCPIFFYRDSSCMTDTLKGVGYNPFGCYIFSYAGK